ncbi:tape measure protein [Hymenobacter fodinae]|uniref:Tape measure protein N-terminal domain-containing protein n=1 Tax=Hymenobacter fodinae TaxID=2510796 RepID=A0A4Z0P0F5_9BACT|nr:tape measure protein [Hymenobacter fodinae]TGE04625.1 hypothetical protein EU556_20790 [Hymenobacter fodinae]
MTTDVGIVVGIKADDSGARVIKRSLDDVSKANKDVEASTRAAETAAIKKANADKALAAETQKVNAATTAAAAAQNKADNAMRGATLGAAKLAEAEKRLGLEAQKTATATAAAAAAQQRADNAMRAAEMQAKRLADQQEKLNENLGRITKTIDAARTAYQYLVAGFAARYVIKAADEYTVMEARIRSIAKSGQETTRVMGELRKISAATGSEMETSLSILQRLSFVREEIKATNNDMLAFTETVTKLGVTSGALPEAMKAGLTQLGQALSSQYTRAEEFNSIMENIPAVGKAIADELGVTTGQMRLLVVEGKLLSSDVFAAILNQTEKVRAEFEQFPRTATQGFKQMTASLDTVIAQANAASGATNGIGMALRGIGEGAKMVYDGLGTTFDYLVAGIQEGVNLIDIAINKVKQSINEVSRFIPGYDGTNFSLSPTVEVGSVFSAANAARKQRERALFGDDFAQAITPDRRAISQDYAKIAAGLNVDKEAKKAADKAAREALKEQKKLQGELDDAVKSSRNEYERLYDTIAEMERLRPFAKTAEETEAIGKNIANARDELDKLRVQAELDSPAGKTFQRFAKSIDDSFADTWRNAFSLDKNGSVFSRMLDGLKSMFVNFLADLTYQAAIRPIVVSLIGGGAGAAGFSQGAIAQTLGSSGGSGGGFSLLGTGSSLLSAGKAFLAGKSLTAGLGAHSLGLSASLGFGAEASGNIANFITRAGTFGSIAGGLAGGIGANLLGLGNRNGYVNAATGTIGGIIGGGLGGPLGAAAGSFLGTAVGGLFGGAPPSDKAEWGGIDLSNGKQFGRGNLKGGNAENEKILANLFTQVTAYQQLIKSVGGKTRGSLFATVGSRDGLRLGTGATEQNFGNDLAAFMSAALKKAEAGTTGLSETFRTILKKVGTGNLKDLSSAFGFGQWYDSLGKVVDPLEAPMKALNDQFDSMFKWANKLGFPLEKINAEYAKQKTALEGNIKAQQAGFSSFEQLTAAFDNFFNSQALGSNSSLNPLQKLDVAQSSFGGLLKKAQGGDLSVTQDLLASANTLLGVGRDVYASGVNFTGLESFVKSSVQSVAQQSGYSGQNVASSIISTNQAVVTELKALRAAYEKQSTELYRLANKAAVGA